jgi:hypothetical protein
VNLSAVSPINLHQKGEKGKVFAHIVELELALHRFGQSHMGQVSYNARERGGPLITVNQ